MKQFPELKKKLEFGLMRLPMIGEEVDIEQTKKMADIFLENGFNYFDTAHGYINGKSELAFKEAVSSRYPRESYILTNKLTDMFFEIAAAKNAVKIPVIANGGVFSNADAEKLLKNTGADGVMVARAALFDPQIFCELTNTPTESKLAMFEKQLKWTGQVCDERFTVVFMRKMAAFYVKGMRGAAAFKERIFKAQTTDEILALVREIYS